jgi:hypothetical protein
VWGVGVGGWGLGVGENKAAFCMSAPCLLPPAFVKGQIDHLDKS